MEASPALQMVRMAAVAGDNRCHLEGPFMSSTIGKVENGNEPGKKQPNQPEERLKRDQSKEGSSHAGVC